jgi:hypothetical protein
METTSTKPESRAKCASCGEYVVNGAGFCHACGASLGTTTGRSRWNVLPWSIAGLAVIALVSLLVGRSYGRRDAESAPRAPVGIARAPDISSMSPEERAQRLFTRVIAYASAGRDDSAAFFAPMAMGAFAALEPLDAHHRFDLGLIAFAVGDMRTASAQADSIIAAEPSNLLGLALAMQSADVGGDTVKRDAFARRLLDAEVRETPRKLPGYSKHESELRVAIEAAKARRS